MRILLVEDDRALNRSLVKLLKTQNYSVDPAFDGQEALDHLLGVEYDLIILDVMMPQMDGFTFIKKLRTQGDEVPVLMLTAKDSLADRITGLDLGADDYLVKPFDVVELVARVEAVLRRYHKADMILTAGDVAVDVEARQVTRKGIPVILTNKEFGLLLLFMRNKNVALFRETLYENVWEGEYSGDSRTVDLHVQRLRRKLGWEHCLVTVYKVGYRLEVSQ